MLGRSVYSLSDFRSWSILDILSISVSSYHPSNHRTDSHTCFSLPSGGDHFNACNVIVILFFSLTTTAKPFKKIRCIYIDGGRFYRSLLCLRLLLQWIVLYNISIFPRNPCWWKSDFALYGTPWNSYWRTWRIKFLVTVSDDTYISIKWVFIH